MTPSASTLAASAGLATPSRSPADNPLAPKAGTDSQWRRETAEPWLWRCLNLMLALALLALDDLATREAASRALPPRDYVAVLVVTAAWFVTRQRIDAGQSFTMVAPTFFGLGAVGRISTMLTVV